MHPENTQARTVTYFIQATDGGPIKIGKATRGEVARRLRALQCGNHRRLIVTRVISSDCEAEMHRRFRALRVGGEWFAPDAELATLAQARPDVDASSAATAYRDGYVAGWTEAVAQAHDDVLESLREQVERFVVLRDAAEGDAEAQARVRLDGAARGRNLRTGFAGETPGDVRAA